MIMSRQTLYLLSVLAVALVGPAEAFLPLQQQPSASIGRIGRTTTTGSEPWKNARTTSLMHMMPLTDDVGMMETAASSPFFLLLSDETAASTESWRQYVPLAAVAFVMIDIALGQPFANFVINRSRQSQSPESTGGADDADSLSAPSDDPMAQLQRFTAAGSSGEAMMGLGLNKSKNPKERVNTAAVAQQALDKAAASKQLRDYLESNKSDWDKIQEMQRKMDQSLEQFDEKQQSKQ